MDFLSVFTVLDPAGTIALAERALIIQAVFFMLIVAVPVYVLIFFFAWRYRAGNTKAKYLPNWEHAKIDELIWWAIPFEIVLILGALTWTSTHALDPRKPLATSYSPLVIEVVALEWKWLFIYPTEDIATVNYLRLPINTPIQFEVTADAPMNSFWIPRLGGQIYAMTGMVNQLYLMANEEGVFEGVSANYSGEGFAHMKFTAEATSQEKYEEWVEETQAYPNALTLDIYKGLANPGVGDVAYYGDVEDDLYHAILMQFK